MPQPAPALRYRLLAAGSLYKESRALDCAVSRGGAHPERRHRLGRVGGGERELEAARVGEGLFVRGDELGIGLRGVQIGDGAPLDRDHLRDRGLGVGEAADRSQRFQLGSLAVAARGEALRSASAAGEDEEERARAEAPQDGLSVTVPFQARVSSQS